MIHVNACGYDSMHKVALDRFRPHGFDDYVLLIVKTAAYFEINGCLQDMPANTIVIYGIHSPIHYGCREPHYNDDWIHFELQDEDAGLLERLSLPVDCPFTLPYLNTLTEYSKLTVQEKLSAHPHKEEVIDSLMHALLYSAADQLHGKSNANTHHKYYYPLQELRLEILNAPYKKWNTSQLAATVHLSVSHFQHLYRQFFGSTCIRDLIHARIKYAQLYLCISEMSISALAQFCGYDTELHFMRQFKKLTGMTPSQYREFHRQMPSSPALPGKPGKDDLTLA